MLVALAISKRYRCFLPPTVSVATKLDLVGEAVVGPSVGPSVGPGDGLLVGLRVGEVGLAVGAHVESSEPWYMVSLYLPIATGFVLFHAGRTSMHMDVLRNTTSEDGAVGREGMQHHSAKANVEYEAP